MLFIKSSVFDLADSGEIEDLRKAVQSAVELEHSTMPPYLYAWYSLGATANQDVASDIFAIVKEEMLHMLLACNILNAIGGHPKIYDELFVPKYPGSLPGTIDIGVQVPLKPFSPQLAREIFMKIEEPEHPLMFKTAGLDALAQPPHTIGEFYARIKKQLQDLEARENANGKTIFTGGQSLQVSSGGLGVARKDQTVSNVQDATRVIDIIVEQGEGTQSSPKFDGKEFAHYYRFAMLAGGKRLIPNPNAKPGDPPDQQYLYGPDTIDFDPKLVLPLVENPKSSDYPKDARDASDACNRVYTNLLHLLHDAFNGSRDIIDDAKEAMGSLSSAVGTLIQIQVVPGKFAGPTFEFMK